jgi:hypothetical protein
MKTYGQQMEASGQKSHPSRFNLGERADGRPDHCIGGLVGTRAGLNAVEKSEICCPCHESNTARPPIHPKLYRLNYLGTPLKELKTVKLLPHLIN